MYLDKFYIELTNIVNESELINILYEYYADIFNCGVK